MHKFAILSPYTLTKNIVDFFKKNACIGETRGYKSKKYSEFHIFVKNLEAFNFNESLFNEKITILPDLGLTENGS
jgi:hypothetical protein